MRLAALVSALCLLGMAALAPVALMGTLDPLRNASFDDIVASQDALRRAIAFLMVVVALDAVSASTLHLVLRGSAGSLSLVAAGLRLAYAAVFAPAVSHLALIPKILASPASADPDSAQLLVGIQLESFYSTWDSGLFLFGLHLLVLGAAVYKSGLFPPFLGPLVALSGLGYTVDSIGRLAFPGELPEVSMYTFFGEVLLMVWLFLGAARGFPGGPVGKTAPAVAKKD
ncbi:hypothetical protein DFJ74DRAFT_674938 [Hyaloraphidium curvatum]|nr:hypothetical protein DFJ74DRAFT_674938 [Hyaloraphidium curvatum]